MDKDVKPSPFTNVSPKPFRQVKLRALWLFMGIFHFAGITVGAFLAANASGENEAKLKDIFDAFVISRSGGYTLWDIFATSFCSSGILLLLEFLLGFTVIGLPGLVAVPVYRGIGLGYIMGFVCGAYGLKGLLICALCVLPQAAVSSAALILSGAEGVRLSLALIGMLAEKARPREITSAIPGYCLKNAVFLGALAFSAVIEMTLSPFFLKILS